MRLNHIVIEHYRSIEHVEIRLPHQKPLILFGPNNAGKSNIISAIDKVLGKRWPPSIELEDSDFFMRDRHQYPEICITAGFDQPYHFPKWGAGTVSEITLCLSADQSKNCFKSPDGKQLYVKSDERSVIQSYVVDAERDISRQLSYYSRYSLLSQFAHAVHDSLTNEERKTLEDAYDSIKQTFEGVPEYSKFFENFHGVIENSVKGFVHDLKVDFSAYDPNNFAKSMRIVAYEENEARSFEEFGTGEQQILLVAFAKAYVQTFGSGSLVLMIEEPEAHLHPLAQRWLKEYIYSLCSDGMQVVISTHSADFLDMSNLDGLVRVCKDDRGVTSVVQLTKRDLVDFCLKSGVPAEKISERNVLDFFGTRLFPDESKGFFATKVLLVEGATEYYALPQIMRTLGHSLVQSGVEIVMANGKNSIPLYWRIFKAFSIQCACLFDGDGKGKDKKSSKNANNQLQALLGIDVNDLLATLDEGAYVTENVAFFKVDFETFMRTKVNSYAQHEEECRKLGIESKPGLARAVCGMISKEELPAFFEELWKKVIRPKSEQEVLDEGYVF